jgi:hypothetical protein
MHIRSSLKGGVRRGVVANGAEIEVHVITTPAVRCYYEA